MSKVIHIFFSNYFSNQCTILHSKDQKSSSHFPHTLNLCFIKKQDIRYGENTHQLAALYTNHAICQLSLATAIQLQGKTLSYNNLADSDTALECVNTFSKPACVIVKHQNPCGVATGNTLVCAYSRAYKTDSTSAFGGIVAFNRQLDANTAKEILTSQFVEVIIAPSIDDNALILLSKNKNIRILASGKIDTKKSTLDFKQINGGLLVQKRDICMRDMNHCQVVTTRQPTQEEIRDAIFSWKVVKYVKSNAIVYAKDECTIGIGAGQTSRLYSVKIATMKAEEEGYDINGSTMASDAFFPFRDALDIAIKGGITCVIQPGGSIYDKKIIATANEYNTAMIFTHMRLFRH